MKNLVNILLFALLFSSCKKEADIPKEWVLQKTVTIDGVNPIGIAFKNGDLWLSDGDHNRLVQINTEGKIVSSIDSLDRPMHIAANGTSLFVPQYGKDEVAIFGSEGEGSVQLTDSLDAPAGVSVYNEERAIADFYNNRILYNNGSGWISFGKEGKAQGEFYYPTDVEITEDKIWVADAYNNRIQVFDKKGNFLKMIGQDQKMNAATGIHVSDDTVFITDFENNRVLAFDMEGNLQQELKEGIEKPTDIMINDNILYIINYRSGDLNMYEFKEREISTIEQDEK